MESTLDVIAIEQIINGAERDPFGVLGPHQLSANGSERVAVRAFQPGARAAWVVLEREAFAMERLHEDGFFEARLSAEQWPLPYRLRFDMDNQSHETLDPYSFPSVLSELDLHLLGEGTHYKNYERLGAHVHTVDGVRGVSFGVWAPNAQRVSVVGDFNQWDGRRHPMRFHPGVGVWDIFIPGLQEGTKYKFELLGPNKNLLPLKADPYGFAFEVRPKTAAVVYDINQYEWQDQEWMANRRSANSHDAPIAIYEVHLGSWRRNPGEGHRMLTYLELAEQLVSYVKQMGFTHIQLMPVSEHPFDGSWGYQTLGYFAPTSRYGSPTDFMQFVDYCHRHGIGVLIDWVPAHFPRDDHGLRHFDGTCLYEHLDPRQGEHPEWGTQIFNFARNEVANFLIGNVLFWFEKYHIDGLRVDAVASMLYLDYGRHGGDWVPNQYGGNHNLEAVAFIKRMNELVHQYYPDVITVAEESTAWAGVSRPTNQGGLGFDLKWNMGWMNDTLRYFHRDPLFRKYHHNDLTFSLIYAFHENFMLPLSHDEVVHGKGALLDKMPGDNWQRFANLRLLYGYMYGHPGKKLLFMGGEFGQWQEWRYNQSLDWHLLEYPSHWGIQRWLQDLNRVLRSEPAMHEVDFDYRGFEWIDFHDYEGSIISFLRRGTKEHDCVVFVMNFTPVVRESYHIGVPFGGYYREILNSDAEMYGGSNVGNGGGVMAEVEEHHARPYSLNLKIPPLAVLVLKPMG